MNKKLKTHSSRYNYEFILLDKSYSLFIEGLERERILKIQESLSKDLFAVLSHYHNLIDRETAYLLILLKFLSEGTEARPICAGDLNAVIEDMFFSLSRLGI